MPSAPAVVLSRGRVHASIRPREGGVLDALFVDGRPTLARTPWADAVVEGPDAAASEEEWVARWRGGWQLCFPSSGQPDGDAATPQAFHGVASQAPWAVAETGGDMVSLCWDDGRGLRAERTWQLTDDGIGSATTAINDDTVPRRIAVAEHLILGGDVLAPSLSGTQLTLDVPMGARLAPLDLAGRPAGTIVDWPGAPGERWGTVDGSTPARVAAIVGRDRAAQGSQRVTVHGPHVRATVSWWGLSHALLWEELGASPDAPWNGSVIALGIEPTTTPHGAGTGAGHGIVTLEPGARMAWRADLAVHWMAA